jgi:hypothetical protein
VAAAVIVAGFALSVVEREKVVHRWVRKKTGIAMGGI